MISSCRSRTPGGDHQHDNCCRRNTCLYLAQFFNLMLPVRVSRISCSTVDSSVNIGYLEILRK